MNIIRKWRIDNFKVAKIGAYIAMISGVLVVLRALGDLSHYDLRVAVGAGLILIGGAILAGAGLFTLAYLIKGSNQKESNT